ncbi:MAG: 1-acyl-sn-glycerol-3-phosphate acyltransferase [Thermoanaerobaculum sp.]|nr:1-acyl-sn-glycerol-3-phosphate acyltransferase [Thermoanaerobaculum sp.]MDW7966916.1 lysophospholipid acyltransferase family protein [Thermoanaerobaculum sp.]
MVVLRIVHTALAFLVAAVDTILMGTYGTLVGLLPPKGDWTRNGARLWARIILWVCGVRLRVEGAEKVPADTPVVFMANHESWLDIPALLVAIPGQVRFLAKKSLFSIPFLGWSMRAMGFIPVDRKNRREAIRSFEEAAERIRAGRSVLVFPEETRTPTGELLPFQRGGFLIALKAQLPIVPVGLQGPRQILAKKRYLLRPGTITVRFGEPVLTAGLGVTAKEALMREVREAVDALRRGVAVPLTAPVH